MPAAAVHAPLVRAGALIGACLEVEEVVEAQDVVLVARVGRVDVLQQPDLVQALVQVVFVVLRQGSRQRRD